MTNIRKKITEKEKETEREERRDSRKNRFKAKVYGMRELTKSKIIIVVKILHQLHKWSRFHDIAHRK